MADKCGAFTFVLHSHLPYCRMAGRWPHGEEWLHEAASETYLPLLNALYDLRDEGIPFRLTIGITPVLTEQLADPQVLENFDLYLQEKITAAKNDTVRFHKAKELHLEYLAGFYRDWYAHTRDTFHGRFGRDIVGAFRRLQDEGYIEIITCAATHGYLPLLSRDSSIYGQLRAGVESYQRHYGRAPRAVWLPECAYRPAYIADESGKPMHSWRVLVLPFIEQQALYERYDFDEPWDSPANLALAQTVIPAFRCPSDAVASGPETNYVMIVGPGTLYDGEESTSMRNIKDGTSNTIMFVEVVGSGINWLEPRDLDIEQLSFQINAPGGQGIQSSHPGGANVAFCDGSVRFLSETIDPQTLQNLITIDDGNPVGCF